MVIQRFTLNLSAKSLHPHHLKIAFQNINGWNEDKKPALTQYFTQLNPDIILFAHTNIHANTAPLKLCQKTTPICLRSSVASEIFVVFSAQE